MDKVSVIIPNYNHARFLKKRIESVLMQSVKPAEIIILDDCSTDGSQDMINQYRDHTLVSHILINDKNSGSPFKQWQKGILYATGDWIWIAESDDYAEQDFLKEMLSLADKYQQAGLLYCDSAIVEGDKVQAESFATVKNRKLNTNRWSNSHSEQGVKELQDYLVLNGTINNTSAVLFKASLLRSFAVDELPLRYIGDKFVFCRMLLKSDIAYSPLILNYYQSGGGKPKHTTDYFQYAFEQYLILDWMLKNANFIDAKLQKKFILQNIQIAFLKYPFKRWGQYLVMMRSNFFLFLSVIRINFKRSFVKIDS